MTEIVLVGGGHAHVHVLVALARKPVGGARVTLVTKERETPYSGMIPGVVAGLYDRAEAHIDLARLCAATNARFLLAKVNGLDRANKRLLTSDGERIAYDIASFDVGITTALHEIGGARDHALSVKPISTFLEKFESLRAMCRAADGPRCIVLIGGGAGGVELILAIRARLLEDARVDGRDAARFLFTLVTAEQLLASSGAKVQRKVRAALERKGVTLVENRRVLRVTADAVHCAGGKLIAADAILVTTHAAPPPWFAETGLALDAGGFLAVGPTLQSTNDADVFGAGDCVGLVKSPREKAGVYAVRAGPPLADNIRRRALGRSSKRWTPQRRHLSILTTGERNAIASWGPFAVEGAWVWRWKNSIDQRWMAAYRDIDAAS